MRHGQGAASTPQRRSARLTTRGKVALAVLVGIVVVALGVLLWVLFRPAPEPVVLPPVPGPTVTGPAPTATIQAVERDTSTELLAAIPDIVLRWSVASQEPQADLLAQGAREAATLVYRDSDEEGAPELTLATAQWRSPEAAAAYVDSLGLEGVPVQEGEVLAGGQPVGWMALYEGESDRLVWTNGSTSFSVLAPSGAALPFYSAFGM